MLYVLGNRDKILFLLVARKFNYRTFCGGAGFS